MLRLWKMSVAFVGMVALAAVLAGSASAEPATYCVKATKVKPPKPAKAHYTGAFSDKACTVANAAGEGKYDAIKPSTFSESEENELKQLLKGKNRLTWKGQWSGATTYAKSDAVRWNGSSYISTEDSNTGQEPTGEASPGWELLAGKGDPGAEGKEGKAGAEGKEGPEGKNAFTAEQLTLLKSVLPHLSFVEAGVGAKPTIRFSGVNLQLLSGAGKTNAAVNGEGNLVIGYDEKPGAQTGSHNLVLGTEQAYTSYGSLIAGERNTDSAPFSDVFGAVNTASGEYASVIGGLENTASGEFSSVSGGVVNVASGNGASVSGGATNKASGEEASVTGGNENIAGGNEATVSGGVQNVANTPASSVSGGLLNTTGGDIAWVGGGYKNNALFALSSIFGGKELKTKAEYEAIP